MKRRIFALVLAILSAMALAAWRVQSWRRDYFASPPSAYATLKEAREAGVLRQGWLPEFLPASATDIREKHNAEQNTTIARFHFDPEADLKSLLNEAEEMPPTAFRGIAPHRIGGSEAWFPDTLFQGNFDNLKPPGFQIYRITRVGKQGPSDVLYAWHLALNKRAGICYLWSSVGLPPPVTSSATQISIVPTSSGTGTNK